MFGFRSRSRPGRRHASSAATALVVCLLTTAAVPAPAGDVADQPQAVSSAAQPTVGVLFADAAATTHECTASVLTVGHGLLLTAGHCVSGTGAGMRFVPGYNGTAARSDPFGVWTVTAAWVPADWLSGQQPGHDIALLRVGDQVIGGQSRSIDQVTGGHAMAVFGGLFDNIWGPFLGPVTVVAYNAGSGDAPVTCTTGGAGDPVPASFRCGGYSGGTSGAPWLQTDPATGRSLLVGLIGGEHQGGCSDDESFTPTFDGQMFPLLLRAALDLPGDDVPAAGDDGC